MFNAEHYVLLWNYVIDETSTYRELHNVMRTKCSANIKFCYLLQLKRVRALWRERQRDFIA